MTTSCPTIKVENESIPLDVPIKLEDANAAVEIPQAVVEFPQAAVEIPQAAVEPPHGKRKRAPQLILEEKKQLVLTVLKEGPKTMDEVMHDGRVKAFVEKAYGEVTKPTLKKARHVLSAFLNNQLDQRIVNRDGKYERGVDHDTRPHMSEKTIVRVSLGDTTVHLTYKEAQVFVKSVYVTSAPTTPASALHAALRQNNGRGPLSNVVYGFTVSALPVLPEGSAFTSTVDALTRFGLAVSL
jgi:hypothetical protein